MAKVKACSTYNYFLYIQTNINHIEVHSELYCISTTVLNQSYESLIMNHHNEKNFRGNGSADSAAHMNRPTLHHHQTATGWLVSDWECSINESGQCTKRRTVKCGHNPAVELRRPALISHHQQSYPQPTQNHSPTTASSRRKCQAGQKPAESETCTSCDWVNWRNDDVMKVLRNMRWQDQPSTSSD